MSTRFDKMEALRSSATAAANVAMNALVASTAMNTRIESGPNKHEYRVDSVFMHTSGNPRRRIYVTTGSSKLSDFNKIHNTN
jgi:hypothetical protein